MMNDIDFMSRLSEQASSTAGGEVVLSKQVLERAYQQIQSGAISDVPSNILHQLQNMALGNVHVVLVDVASAESTSISPAKVKKPPMRFSPLVAKRRAAKSRKHLNAVNTGTGEGGKEQTDTTVRPNLDVRLKRVNATMDIPAPAKPAKESSAPSSIVANPTFVQDYKEPLGVEEDVATSSAFL